RTGLTGSQARGLTTRTLSYETLKANADSLTLRYQPTPSLISLTANIGRSWVRRRPPYIPTL
ncbi:MAG: hypothetical protein ACYT04_85160, partial [Nostoc sp.]